MAQAAKYVYGVVRASSGAKPRGKGIGGGALRVIAADGLGALTNDVAPGPLEAGRDELLDHSRVLEEAIGRGTILPMAFGVVMPDESAVRRELLEAHRPQLEAQLEDMEGKVEVNVKGLYDEQAVLSEVVEEEREVAQLRDAIRDQPADATYYERIRLGERVAELLEAKREADGAAVVDELASHAVAVEVGEPIHERMAVNASFLVERDALEDFDAALERIAEGQGGRIRFKLTGPLAPHSFVELAMGG